jgi:triosephosphate isomerase
MIVGNWKMHGSLEHCLENVPRLAEAVCPQVALVICPPALYLSAAFALASASELRFGAQDVSSRQQGAYTGEWSAAMLADVGCRYAIVGHSERRQYHGESDELVAAKAQACLDAGITPIACIGETEAERMTGQTEAVLARQLQPLLALPGRAELVIAYEPVWAIGSGRTATPGQAQQAHAFIRQQLAVQDPALAACVPLLYGGSVKPDNAAQLFAMADVDGGLVGGASLEADSLLAIYRAMPQFAGVETQP